MSYVKFRIYIRRFLARRFSKVVNVYYFIKFKFTNFNKYNPIIILTPGKVGSSSVYKTLIKHFKNVFHIHHLSKNGILKSKKKHLLSDRKSLPLHLIISSHLSKKLKRHKGNVYIITIIREPISREISSFFQNTELYKNQIEGRNLTVNVTKSVEILQSIFNVNITSELEEWFETEIRDQFEIDVFKNSFVKNKGYMVLENGRFKLLLMKMETLNQVFEKAMQEFLKLNKHIILEKSNVGENKYYAKAYKKIKDELAIKEVVINEIISSRYFQHFYEDLGIEVRKRWVK